MGFRERDLGWVGLILGVGGGEKVDNGVGDV